MDTVVINELRETVIVAARGPQGPPGPGGADAYYVHSQTSPSTVWVVVHGLGKRPAVTVLDSAGTRVFGSETHNSANQVTLTFSAALSGVAYFS